ncbi:Dihydrolipoamide transacylase (alpha-keto acid dehydrogenase E2 subunit) [Handroanthus impetiginosus]|uniref:Dihydrolipoamide acetyltransferase component of pyruvate dehydrogenase complex n=1 Tax=Handroanthus impetiginosus TaxID=429701 RepID=A0A2G9G5G7_9LAMI|nr:Dihydrolipoamide transacylase (alpha-keto acid dehydrogenase E2 subunit) [Handroanthus impetiginosus]
MIFRKIYQKNPWSSSRWRFVCSATLPPSSAAGTASERTGFELGSFSGAQTNMFSNSRKLFFLKNPYERFSLSTPFGIKGRNYTTQTMTDLPIGGVIDVPLAQTGEGIAECELLKWFVQEGDQVEEFQPLCEVQSDKATIEITSRYNGRVSKILHVPGNIVKVGETLLKMVVDENAFSDQCVEASEVIKTQDSNISESDVAESGLRKAKIGGVLSTPAVRNLAKQLSVNIEDVCGTGKDGRVLKEDVLNYAACEGILKETSSSAEQYPQEDQRFPEVSPTHRWEYEDRAIPLRGFQRAMVKSMTLAAKIPHFHYVEEINCDTLIELKASLQSENTDPGVSCFNEELQEVTVKGSHNIGIAMATRHGLVVPNIKKVQSLSILEITKELSRLQELAQANKLSSDDISGGTITLSNIGAIGGKFGSPLINVPEVSIIAMGRIQKIPQFDEDGIVYPASIMTVNIGADHRVLDGATVAKFCNEWKLLIEKPELLMLHMR